MSDFSWNEDVKEMYFIQAEKRISRMNLSDHVKVNRGGFAVNTKEDTVGIYIAPIDRRGNSKLWQQVKEIDGFIPQKMKMSEFGKRIKPLFYHGQIKMQRDLSIEKMIENCRGCFGASNCDCEECEVMK